MRKLFLKWKICSLHPGIETVQWQILTQTKCEIWVWETTFPKGGSSIGHTLFLGGSRQNVTLWTVECCNRTKLQHLVVIVHRAVYRGYQSLTHLICQYKNECLILQHNEWYYLNNYFISKNIQEIHEDPVFANIPHKPVFQLIFFVVYYKKSLMCCKTSLKPTTYEI